MLSFITGLFTVLVMTSSVQATEKAQYYRAWQGFKSQSLSQQQFLKDLAPFMRETVDLYQGRALNNYIVIMPPAVKPNFIPDEFALVALSSRENYQAIRSTPEGQRYSDRHWDVFDKATSKSADPMVDFTTENPTKLAHNHSYNVLGNPVDWSQGTTMVYIGLRRPHLTPDAFLTGLAKHLALVKKLQQPKGLRGYIVIANDNYEVAFMNWEEKFVQNATVSADGAALMTPLMFQEAKRFNAGDDVSHAKAYSTIY